VRRAAGRAGVRDQQPSSIGRLIPLDDVDQLARVRAQVLAGVRVGWSSCCVVLSMALR